MGIWTATPRTWVAGEVPTATHFNDNLRDFARGFTDAWTSYTPTLTASTTNPTNWTQTGYYMQAGKLVICKFKITAGGSMTSGSGAYRIALPVNANVTVGDIEPGMCVGVDNNTSAFAMLAPYITNTAYVQLGYAATYLGAATVVAHNAPWTWAANDVIRGTIIYEAA